MMRRLAPRGPLLAAFFILSQITPAAADTVTVTVLRSESITGVSAFIALSPAALERVKETRVANLVGRIRDRATALYGIDVNHLGRVALAFKGRASDACALLLEGDGLGVPELERLFGAVFSGVFRTARVGGRDMCFVPGILSGLAEPGQLLVAPGETAGRFVEGTGVALSADASYNACIEPLKGLDPDFLLFAMDGTWLAGVFEKYLNAPELIHGVRAVSLALKEDVLVFSASLVRDGDPDELAEALRGKIAGDEVFAKSFAADGASTRENALYMRFRVAPETRVEIAYEAARRLLDYFPEDKRIEQEIVACSKRAAELKLKIVDSRLDPALLNKSPETSCPYGGIYLDRSSEEGLSIDCTRHSLRVE